MKDDERIRHDEHKSFRSFQILQLERFSTNVSLRLHILSNGYYSDEFSSVRENDKIISFIFFCERRYDKLHIRAYYFTILIWN